MSCKVMNGTQPRFHFHFRPSLTLSTTNNPSIHQSLKFYLPKTRISIKTINRTRTKSSINCLYATAQSSAETFYELLGLPETVSQLEIKPAYKKLARKYHPDVSPPGRAEEYTTKFIRVHEAYETLSDPRSRALYDMDMSKGLHFAFSARKGDQYDQSTRNWRWQSQIVELNRRSQMKNSRASDLSWAERMRRQRSKEYQ